MDRLEGLADSGRVGGCVDVWGGGFGRSAGQAFLSSEAIASENHVFPEKDDRYRKPALYVWEVWSAS